jgi:DNA-binding NarL/FixJ family response regulator
MYERVLIVDDHAGFRSMARRLLVAGDYDVVGEAADGTEAIDMVHALRPDVVLLDIQLPDIDGFQVAQALSAQREPPVIVLISSRARSDYGTRVTDSGVHGFIGKSDLSAKALRSLVGGTDGTGGTVGMDGADPTDSTDGAHP